MLRVSRLGRWLLSSMMVRPVVLMAVCRRVPIMGGDAVVVGLHCSILWLLHSGHFAVVHPLVCCPVTARRVGRGMGVSRRMACVSGVRRVVHAGHFHLSVVGGAILIPNVLTPDQYAERHSVFRLSEYTEIFPALVSDRRCQHCGKRYQRVSVAGSRRRCPKAQIACAATQHAAVHERLLAQGSSGSKCRRTIP